MRATPTSSASRSTERRATDRRSGGAEAPVSQAKCRIPTVPFLESVRRGPRQAAWDKGVLG
jgi:hypothetical protein